VGAPLGTRCRLCLWTARALADRARAGVPCGSPFDPPIWRVDLACGFQILATNLHWPAAPDDVLDPDNTVGRGIPAAGRRAGCSVGVMTLPA